MVQTIIVDAPNVLIDDERYECGWDKVVYENECKDLRSIGLFIIFVGLEISLIAGEKG